MGNERRPPPVVGGAGPDRRPTNDRAPSLLAACSGRHDGVPVDPTVDRLLMRIARRRKWALHRHVHLVAAYEAAAARRPIETFLSIGCSAGLPELFLAASHPSVRFHLTDVDPALLDRARSTGAELGLANVTYGHLDLLAPRSVPRHDFVACIEVLEHIEDDITAARNLRDHADGALYVLVPFCSAEQAAHPGKRRWAWQAHEHHRVGYTHDAFRVVVAGHPTRFHRNCYFMPDAGRLRARLDEGSADELVAQRVDLVREAAADVRDELVAGGSLEAEAIEALIVVSPTSG